MRFIKLNDDNVVISVRYGKKILDGEYQSDVGEINQIMQSDGTFVDKKPEEIHEEPTIEEQILTETQYQTALLEMQLMGGV